MDYNHCYILYSVIVYRKKTSSSSSSSLWSIVLQKCSLYIIWIIIIIQYTIVYLYLYQSTIHEMIILSIYCSLWIWNVQEFIQDWFRMHFFFYCIVKTSTIYDLMFWSKIKCVYTITIMYLMVWKMCLVPVVYRSR